MAYQIQKSEFKVYFVPGKRPKIFHLIQTSICIKIGLKLPPKCARIQKLGEGWISNPKIQPDSLRMCIHKYTMHHQNKHVIILFS